MVRIWDTAETLDDTETLDDMGAQWSLAQETIEV